MMNSYKEIEIPEFCPCCESELQLVKDQLFCRNPACEAKSTMSIVHFCKVLKIKGLGEKTIEKLGLSSIEELYRLHEDTLTAILGEKIGTKILHELQRSVSADLVDLLQAFGIPSIGEVAAKKLCGVITELHEIDEESCKKAGLGPSATAKLLDWLEENEEMCYTLPFSFTTQMPKATKTLGVRVVITGRLLNYKNREEASSYLTSLGFTVVDSVSNKTNFLILEEDKPSSKIDKANSLNIPILTIQQLLERHNIK